MSEDVMIPKYNIPLEEEREVALQRLQVRNTGLSVRPSEK